MGRALHTRGADASGGVLMTVKEARVLRDSLRAWSTRLRTPGVDPARVAVHVAGELDDAADWLEYEHTLRTTRGRRG